MEDLGYGQDYKYAHDFPGGIVEQSYLPAELGPRSYYQPTERGMEKIIAQRLTFWRKKMNRKL